MQKIKNSCECVKYEYINQLIYTYIFLKEKKRKKKEKLDDQRKIKEKEKEKKIINYNDDPFL